MKTLKKVLIGLLVASVFTLPGVWLGMSITGCRTGDREIKLPPDPIADTPGAPPEKGGVWCKMKSAKVGYKQGDSIYWVSVPMDGSKVTDGRLAPKGQNQYYELEFEGWKMVGTRKVQGISGAEAETIFANTWGLQYIHIPGDVNFDGSVDMIDVAATKARNGEPVDEINWWFDVNCDGYINLIDMAMVKSLIGSVQPMTTASRTQGVAPLAVFFDAINE